MHLMSLTDIRRLERRVNEIQAAGIIPVALMEQAIERLFDEIKALKADVASLREGVARAALPPCD
jgi:hypothetical protein